MKKKKNDSEIKNNISQDGFSIKAGTDYTYLTEVLVYESEGDGPIHSVAWKDNILAVYSGNTEGESSGQLNTYLWDGEINTLFKQGEIDVGFIC